MRIFGHEFPGYQEERAALRQARAALDANAEMEIREGIDYETWEFNELNHEVREAEKAVPWYLR